MKGNVIMLSYLLLVYCLSNCSSPKGLFNNYDGSIKEGVWIEISVDSIGFEKVKYKNGIKEGRAEIYLGSGNVAIGKYQSGKKNGVWKYYNQNKELYKIEYYTEDYLSLIEIYEKGKVVRQAISDPTF